MAKFSGRIGYADTRETSPGVWEEVFIRKQAYGDVLRNNRKLENGDLGWMGAKWKITNVEVLPPRLILTIGGVYNGPTGWTTRPTV